MKRSVMFSFLLIISGSLQATPTVTVSNSPAVLAVDEFARQALAEMEAQPALRNREPDGSLARLYKEQLAQYLNAGFREMGTYSVYKENQRYRSGARNFGQPEYHNLLELAERHEWFRNFTNKLNILRSWMNGGRAEGRFFIVKRVSKNIDPLGLHFFVGEIRLVVTFREVRDGDGTKIELRAESIETEFHQRTRLEGGGSSAGSR